MRNKHWLMIIPTLLLLFFLPLLLLTQKASFSKLIPQRLSVSGFFVAQQSQNLHYDLNRDEAVTAEDYPLLIQRLDQVKGVSTDRVLAETSEDPNDPATPNIAVPSVRSFAADVFYGAATISHDFSLPAGTAGMTPGLTLNYSSGSVDDQFVGTESRFRNGQGTGFDHSYQVQSGLVGLGWNLGGVQSISRNTNGTLNDLRDDTFIINFAGGSAQLTKESGDDTYAVFRTIPNLKIKVERLGLCKTYSVDTLCRYSWQVTTGDGTRYTFGPTAAVSNWLRDHDPEKKYNFTGDWYPLYEDSPASGHTNWTIYLYNNRGKHGLPTAWYLSKIESVYSSTVTVNYQYGIEFGTYTASSGNFDYPKSIYPSYIKYSPHEIVLSYENRLDYQTHLGDNDPAAGQGTIHSKRLKSVDIKTLGKSRSYTELSYIYGYRAVDHPSAPTGFTPGRAVHSLLTGITVYSDNTKAKKLPGQTFSYGANCNGFIGGCPLTSRTGPNSNIQSQTPNDFFLISADNGYKGKTTFSYFYDSTNSNAHALNIKYCDRDKSTADGQTCKTDNSFNTQRHRIESVTTLDGMNNSYLTKYVYPTVDTPPIALGAVKNYQEGTTFFSDFEFLGYPEVYTYVYHKNSSTSLASKTNSTFFQAIDTANCFKPSPFKGMVNNVKVYDVADPAKRTDSRTDLRVRLGPMNGPWEDTDPAGITGKCGTYDPGTTVSLVYPSTTVTGIVIGNNYVHCTRTARDYKKFDGSYDAYFLPHTTTDYGKVSCTDPYNVDDTSDVARTSFTDYTEPNLTKWLLPQPKETWIGSSTNKYQHTKIYYDNQSFGTLGNYGNPTKVESLIDGVIKSSTLTTYHSTYPWQITRVADPRGYSTSTEYDTAFRIFPTKVTNAKGQTTQMIYDFTSSDTSLPNNGGVMGLPIKTLDANGDATHLVYDKFGRLTETYLPGKKPGSGTKPDTFNEYYYFNTSDLSPCTKENNCLPGLGQQISGQYGPKMAVYTGTRLDDSVGSIGKVSLTHNFYNGLGQSVQTRQLWYDGEYSASGIPVDSSLSDLVTSTAYNALGQTVWTSLPYAATPFVPGSGNSYTPTTTPKTTTYAYDGQGRPTTTTRPDGTKEITSYDLGNSPLQTKRSNPNCTDGNSSTPCADVFTTVDAFGQTLHTQEQVSGTMTIYDTRYEYHPVLGTLIKTKDTNNNYVSVIEYDKLGRKTKMWDADMSPAMTGDTNAWRYEYDAAGNLEYQTNPKQIKTTLTYDQLNRLTTKRLDKTLVQSNTYDTCTKGVGRLCETISYDPTTASQVDKVQFTYDSRGRTVKTVKTLSNMPDAGLNQAYTWDFTYDSGGRTKTSKLTGISAFSLPEETLSFLYNRNYVSALSGTNVYASDAKYNLFGQLTAFTSGNSVANTYTYDANSLRLSSINISGANIPEADRLKVSYKYDPLGNILETVDNRTSIPAGDPFHRGIGFSYDALSRLLSATGVAGAYVANYTYDNIGNIKTKTEGSTSLTLNYGAFGTRSYHTPSSVISGSTTQNFTYDAVGNTITDGLRSHTYDLDNRLQKISPASSGNGITETRFIYDSAGQRLAKIITGGETVYYISPELEIIKSPTGQFTWRKNYYFAGKLAAVRSYSTSVTPVTGCSACDFDGDGIFTTSDATALANCVINPTATACGNRDPNGDGKLDAGDLSWCPINCSSTGTTPTPPAATSTPTRTPTPTPSCTLDLSPIAASITIGRNPVTFTAKVVAGAVTRVDFSASSTIVNISPTSDTLSPFSTSVSCKSAGSTTLKASSTVTVNGVTSTCSDTSQVSCRSAVSTPAPSGTPTQ